ncbi:helix-hairpin-helix domain-containing protein [Actinomyces sp. 2119]|uniref:helix-hairpin-helix domain-containing protein n=1 Tax=Actinomyces sp. 2119 TaxID=2321393 RepID=UPI00217609D1|nr:helix-hairpin-helix domain-containing protein [Actinomyces sp. 2119]
MSGRRQALGRSGNWSVDRLVRLACSPDPDEPPTRPRRVALAPRAAVVAGTLLMVLAAVLAVRTALGAPAAEEGAPGGAEASGSGESLPQAPATAPATQVQGEPPTDPRATTGSGAAGQPGQADSSQDVGQVVVHVTGAVASPGVVVLDQGARVADAIEAAGGVTQEADADQLNLARVLSDGEQVRVPREGEVLTGQEAEAGQAGEQQPGQSASGASQDGPGQEATGLVNINTASALELEELPGIGPALAQRIVEHREANGPFGSVDELTEVSGIGQAKLEALREMAVV